MIPLLIHIAYVKSLYLPDSTYPHIIFFVVVLSFQLESQPSGWLSASQYIIVRDVQSLNASLPIVVTLFGISMLVKDSQLLNAPLPIVVTLFGIVMFVKDVHLLNA